MPYTTRADSLPSPGGETAAPPRSPTPPTGLSQAGPNENAPDPVSRTGGAADKGTAAMPMPPANARLATSVLDADKDEDTTPKAAARAAAAAEISGPISEGASQILRVDKQVNGGISQGCSGPVELIFARRRAGTGSSNPMADSSAGGAPTIMIPFEIQLRQAGVPVPTNERNPHRPASIANYSRRLSKESLEGLEKVLAKQDVEPELV